MSTPTIPQFGVIGYPIHHSKSPIIHNAAFRQTGIAGNYSAIEVPPNALPELFARLRDQTRSDSLRGVNVTVPLKQAVIPFLDQLSPEAQEIGAVNTILNQNGVLFGTNTDAPGFVKSLRDDFHFSCPGARVSIIGAGGSARAIAVGLKRAGAQAITIINRSESSASELKSSLVSSNFWVDCHLPNTPDSIKALAESDLIVQTTSVGMSPSSDISPISDFSWVHSNQLVIDIIYAPETTLFLQTCADKGAATGNGMGMLLAQAALAFELFSGIPAPLLTMRKAFYEQ